MSYHHENDRLLTFNEWNISYIDKYELAKWGFYYIGPKDIVRCYSCHVEIGQWEIGDNVFDEHKKWSPDCNLICNNTNTILTNTVSEGSIESLREDDIHAFPHSSFNENNTKNIVKYDMNNNPCIICYEKKIDIIIKPCNHVIMCRLCISKINYICPICKETIEKIEHVYLS